MFVHYGHKKFDKSLFKKIENNAFFTKPNGGLWACMIDMKYNWIDWCNNNDYCSYEKDDCFYFDIKSDTRILNINTVDDLLYLPRLKHPLLFSKWTILDFEKLAEEYDIINVYISNDYSLYDALYGWDCDSSLICNPDCIILH